jgi:transposase
MIDADKRQAVFLLHQEGMGRSQIARQLRISPNTVEAIIEQKGQMPVHTRKDKIQVDPDLLERLYQECDGYAQRVHEKLVEDERIQIQYSTLTRLLRQQGLRRSREPRCQRVPDEPGAEMQHDTTRYSILLGGARTMLVAWNPLAAGPLILLIVRISGLSAANLSRRTTLPPGSSTGM